MKFAGLFLMSLMISLTAAGQKTDKWLARLLYSNASPLLKKVLDNPQTYQYQIVYTRIDRDKHNKPHFKSFYLNTDRSRYFNPASTVKLPTALMALEKLNDLKIKDLDKDAVMITDSGFSAQTRVLKDTSAESGYPSVGHYIKKIFLVSDNDAYNQLYEWVGQKTLNEKLWQKGYEDLRITRRFYPMTEEENRHTNPVRFLKEGKMVYSQPGAYSTTKFDFSKKILVGKAHFDRNEVLVNEPMDFTRHNNFPLEDQQKMLRSVLFPESVKAKERFNLTVEDYTFLYKYLSMLPRESDYPHYDSIEFFDGYAKFFIYKADKLRIPSYMKIFSKAGWSYGFLTDNAYIADLRNHCEFMISATIYVNSDGVLNDDKYDYDTIGYPFFKEVGNILYQTELKRIRKHQPNLNF